MCVDVIAFVRSTLVALARDVTALEWESSLLRNRLLSFLHESVARRFLLFPSNQNKRRPTCFGRSFPRTAEGLFGVFCEKAASKARKRWVWRRTGRARRRSPSWTRRKRSCSGPTRRAPSSSSPTSRCPARPKLKARPRVNSTTRYKHTKHTIERSVRRPSTRLSPNMAS